MSLLFAGGTRPSADDIERLVDAAGQSSPGARISHRPPDDDGWLELLANGLTFDLRGLAPGSASPNPVVGQVYGLPADIGKFEFEAMALTPGAHIAAGGPMMPVVRVLLGLAANLALQLPITAVCWNPAQSWMEPKYFGRMTVNWLSGGPFPVLGLTSVRRRADGAVESSGLAYFTGQEVCVAARRGEPGSETIKLATRIIDELLRNGPVDQREELHGTGGELLIAQPSPDKRLVLVSRGE